MERAEKDEEFTILGGQQEKSGTFLWSVGWTDSVTVERPACRRIRILFVKIFF